MSRRTRTVLLSIGGAVLAILLLGGGFLFGISPDYGGRVTNDLSLGCTSPSANTADLQLQQEVLSKLEGSYYEQFDSAKLETDAIDGMVAGLNDPYTVYMDPSEYSSFIQDTRGSYSGVGMVVELKDQLVTIISLFKDSPADAAGIKPGDIILSVDGKSASGQNLDEVVSQIKGAEGTSVTLEIYRPPAPVTTTTAAGSAQSTTTTETTTSSTDESDAVVDNSQLPPGGTTKTYTLTRKTIAIPVTERETLTAPDGEKVALIHFFTFSSGSGDALRAEVENAVSTDHVAAIILDLRSNGGGLLDQAIAVASIFIPSGRIVSTQGLHSPEQVYNATGNAFAQTPLYVLTDPYTASASEIVSGALQDYKRATLVGETTFGKGLVQSIEPLSNGGALKVTTAQYLTPNGRDINKKGITPDVVAPDDPNTPTVDETVQKALDLIAAASSGK
jgi:carboxyl-terminal processing protease